MQLRAFFDLPLGVQPEPLDGYVAGAVEFYLEIVTPAQPAARGRISVIGWFPKWNTRIETWFHRGDSSHVDCPGLPRSFQMRHRTASRESSTGSCPGGSKL